MIDNCCVPLSYVQFAMNSARERLNASVQMLSTKKQEMYTFDVQKIILRINI